MSWFFSRSLSLSLLISAEGKERRGGKNPNSLLPFLPSFFFPKIEFSSPSWCHRLSGFISMSLFLWAQFRFLSLLVRDLSLSRTDFSRSSLEICLPSRGSLSSQLMESAGFRPIPTDSHISVLIPNRVHWNRLYLVDYESVMDDYDTNWLICIGNLELADSSFRGINCYISRRIFMWNFVHFQLCITANHIWWWWLSWRWWWCYVDEYVYMFLKTKCDYIVQ